ncbi:hypothetical protein [Komagataeibacter xylinus]|uniref:hypothetical protein n=1 Tax=Komagataeibacter xylinus TaxID=28448 RepID=UPI00280A7BB0|nr:hypothetical protein [Komagataeibacter xylinus]
MNVGIKVYILLLLFLTADAQFWEKMKLFPEMRLLTILVDMREKSMYWLIRAAEYGMCNAMEQLAYLYCSEGGLCLVYHYKPGLRCKPDLPVAALFLMAALNGMLSIFVRPKQAMWRNRAYFERHAHELTTVYEDDEPLILLSCVVRLRGQCAIAQDYFETTFFQL